MSKIKAFLGLAIIATLGFSFASLAAEDNIPGPEEIASLRASAESGDAEAQLELGDAYQKGEGVRQDDTQAARWYAQAANQGNADAQFALGFSYRGGFGVPRDEVLAYMWFDLASARGNEEASDLRSAVAELMTYDQISEARKRSREWKPKPPEKVAD